VSRGKEPGTVPALDDDAAAIVPRASVLELRDGEAVLQCAAGEEPDCVRGAQRPAVGEVVSCRRLGRRPAVLSGDECEKAGRDDGALDSEGSCASGVEASGVSLGRLADRSARVSRLGRTSDGLRLLGALAFTGSSLRSTFCRTVSPTSSTEGILPDG
jgi:hypothetical protein